MSKIKELLNDKDSILVFDIDGVLAVMEFGNYNHFGMTSDEEWNKACEKTNFYTKELVSKKTKKFLKDKNRNNIYIISRVCNKYEINHKIDFAYNYYGILKENIYLVLNENSKIKELNMIRKKHKDVKDYQIIMIDDSVNVLSEVQEKTNYSTAHISSFLDI